MDKFKPGSTVYAFHGPLMYEAKVLKVHEKNKSYIEIAEGKQESLEGSKLKEEMLNVNMYFLHYHGWKSKWDEWVTDERLLEHNEENRRIKAEMDESTRKKRVTKKETPISSGNADEKNTKKRQGSEKPQNKRKKDSLKLEITIEIEPDLKYLLVDDWEFITKNRQLIEVPCEYTVSRILGEYERYRKETSDNMNAVHEILNGLEVYFNKSLSLILLYKFERLQYLNLLKDGVTREKSLSQIYGLIHFLRLFVSLPGLISQTSMDALSIGVLIQEAQEILKFIGRNLPRYMNTYINPTPNYDSLARS